MATINVTKTVSQIAVNSTTNTVTVTETPVQVTVNAASYSPVDSVNGKTGAVVLTTTDVSEGTNQYFTTTRARSSFSAGSGISINNGVITNTGAFYNDALARAAISVTDNGGDGALTYNTNTGVIAYTGPTPSEVRSHFSAGTGITLVNGTITNTAPFTTAGVRSSLSAGTGVTYNSSTGVISIGQAVGTTNNVTFNDVTVSGDLNVQGTLTTVNTGNLTVNDNKIVLNAGETGAPNLDASVIVERGTSADVSLKWNESLDRWQQTRDGTTYTDIPVSTTELAEGTNQYFTDGRARAAISVTDSGGDGSLVYDSNTGILNYTGPSATEVRSHFSNGRNITITNGSVAVNQTMNDMVAVRGESTLSLAGDTVIVNTRAGGTDDPSLVFFSDGWSDDGYHGTSGGPSTPRKVVSGGSVSNAIKLRRFNLSGSTTSGSNQITVTNLWIDTVAGYGGTLVTDINTVASQLVGQDVIDDPSSAILGGANCVAYITFPKGTKVTGVSVNAGATNTATITVSNNALRSYTFDGTPPIFGGTGLMQTTWIAENAAGNVRFSIGGHDGTNETTSVVGLFALKETISPTIGTRALSYFQPTVFTADFVTTPVIEIYPRKITQLRGPNFSKTNTAGNIITNEHINVPRSLTVGPNAITTSRGTADDSSETIGLSLSNDGTLTGYASRLSMNITQFKDNSYYTGFDYKDKHFVERAGPYITLNQYAGNRTTTLANRYLTLGDGVGHIGWYAQANSSAYSSLSRNPASINVRASETMDTGSKQGLGMYLQHTPNAIGAGAPRTFLLAENDQVELRALRRVQIKPYLRNLTVATNAGSFNSSTLRLTLTFTTTRTNIPYGIGQQVSLSGFTPSEYNSNSGTTWNVVSCTTSQVVLETSSTNITSSTTAPTAYGNITTTAIGRAAYAAGQPHFWLEASDYAGSPGNTAEGTGTLVKIAADNNDGHVGLMLRRTAGSNTANFELKLPSGSSNTLQVVNNSNSTTPVTVDNSKVAFTLPVKLPAYTAAALQAIVGEVGWTAAVSDNGGKLAYWDTANNRWSYVSTDAAV